MKNEYWNSEVENNILQYQITKDERLLNIIYPKLILIASGLVKRFQYKSNLWTEDEMIITVVNDIIMNGTLLKYIKTDKNGLTYFTHCINSKLLTYVVKSVKEKKTDSLDVLFEDGFDVEDEYYKTYKL